MRAAIGCIHAEPRGTRQGAIHHVRIARNLLVPTIISEHYNQAGLGQSTTLERSYFGLGWGRYRWEPWSANPPPRGDLSQACPNIPVWEYAPPLPNVQLTDCRMWTNIVAAPGNFALNQYAWGWP
jgi:hypothetical protein